ncbi:MAG: ribosomal-processing cysteine protease Prp [Lachnospiraceae bacterium]|jgi:hypothetical protein|nr:ribosomal-processing cysteine protease Prp [Lachnospiraceae bacterium]
MTRVQIFRTRDGQYRSFTCKGHTEYTAEGADIVCAGVSAIVINTINCLDDLLHIKMDVDFDEENGGDITCNLLEDPGEKGNLLIDCMIHGFDWIISQYGEGYLRYVIKEVDQC